MVTGFTITRLVTFISIGIGGGTAPAAACALAGCDVDESGDGGKPAQPERATATNGARKVILAFSFIVRLVGQSSRQQSGRELSACQNVSSIQFQG